MTAAAREEGTLIQLRVRSRVCVFSNVSFLVKAVTVASCSLTLTLVRLLFFAEYCALPARGAGGDVSRTPGAARYFMPRAPINQEKKPALRRITPHFTDTAIKYEP